MKERAKNLLKFLLRIGLSLGLLAWFFTRIDPEGFVLSLKGISRAAFLLAFSMYLLSQVISSIRWYVLSRALGFPGGLITYLRYYFVGMYFNLFLPTGVGGDFFKIMYLTKERHERLAATYSIILDRGLGLSAMFFLGGLAAALFHPALPKNLSLVLKGISFCIVVLPLMIALLYKIKPGYLHRLISGHEKLFIFIRRPGSILLGFFFSILLQALGMDAVAVLGHGMGLGIETSYYFSVFPLVALAIIIPISFNGIGVREGGFIYFLGLRGIPQEKALTLSLSFFGIQVISSLIGGIVYGLGLHKR